MFRVFAAKPSAIRPRLIVAMTNVSNILAREELFSWTGRLSVEPIKKASVIFHIKGNCIERNWNSLLSYHMWKAWKAKCGKPSSHVSQKKAMWIRGFCTFYILNLGTSSVSSRWACNNVFRLRLHYVTTIVRVTNGEGKIEFDLR